MRKENILERANFANEVLSFDKRSLFDPKMSETLYKQKNGSWIIINNPSGEYTNANPDFERTLDNIQQRISKK